MQILKINRNSTFGGNIDIYKEELAKRTPQELNTIIESYESETPYKRFLAAREIVRRDDPTYKDIAEQYIKDFESFDSEF